MRTGKVILLFLLPMCLVVDTGCKPGSRIATPAEPPVRQIPDWPPVLADTLAAPERTEIVEIADDSHLPYISITRSGCYGHCPAYTLEIYSDGTVQYYGRAHVSKMGRFAGNIDPATVNRLLQFSRTGGFSKLPASIPETMSRSEYFNATVISMRTSPGNFHTVTYWYGEPTILRELEAKIMLEVADIEWENQ